MCIIYYGMSPIGPFPPRKNGGPGKVACRSIRWLWVFPWPIPKCNFVVSIIFSIVTVHIKKEWCLQMSHLRKKPKKKVPEQTNTTPKNHELCMWRAIQVIEMSHNSSNFLDAKCLQSSNNDNTWGFCQGHTNCCKNVPFKMQNFVVMTMYDCICTRYSWETCALA